MKHLKIARILKGLTQWELSAKTGLPNYRISLIENGRIDPTHEELQLLAGALGTTVEKIGGPAVEVHEGWQA